MQQVLGSGMEGAVGWLRSSGQGRVTCGFPSNGCALLVPICLPWPLPQSRSSKARQRLVKNSWPHHLLPTHATLFPVFHVNHHPFHTLSPQPRRPFPPLPTFAWQTPANLEGFSLGIPSSQSPLLLSSRRHTSCISRYTFPRATSVS